MTRELERIERKALTLASAVEEQINKSIVALKNSRPDLAEEVIAGDDEIDEREVELEEDCLKILALHQPVAVDLRYIIAMLTVTGILERMGDQASNIAHCAIDLAAREPVGHLVDFDEIFLHVKSMVQSSLDSLINFDVELARKVLRDDDEVDRAYWAIFRKAKEMMVENPATIDQGMLLALAARNLERVGDLATNIAEDLIFLVEGEIVRHHPVRLGSSQNGTGR
jgi:phosphate transport system protein